MVSDAVAALTALRAQPGLPSRGIVALCDFGATGTTITLADAAAGFRAVGESVRFEEFCGEQIDQAILKHVIADLDVDPSSTSAVVALTRFREECRIAKERLSCETATGLTVPLPGPQCTVRLTRAELETLIRDPLDGLIGALVTRCSAITFIQPIWQRWRPWVAVRVFRLSLNGFRRPCGCR